MQLQWLALVTLGLCGADYSLGSNVEEHIRVGAFNIRAFGRTKVNRPEVVNILIQIVRRYDILFVVEIRDKSEEAMKMFLNFVNQNLTEPVFKMNLSGQLGRGSYKEKYGFFYNSKRVRLVRSLQFIDKDDNWERNPFLAEFSVPSAYVEKLTFIGLHVKPDAVVKELESVPAVVDFLEKQWKSKNIIIAGDLNCDCSYIYPDEFQNLKIRTDPRYQWLINQCAGRTMIATNCIYDRIITVGSGLLQHVVKDSSQAFAFDEEFSLTKDEALNVSDHRPVECQIAGKRHGPSDRFESDWSFAVRQTITDNWQNAVRAIYRSAELTPSRRGHFNVTLLKKGFRNFQTTAVRLTDDVAQGLRDFEFAFPNVLTTDTMRRINTFATRMSKILGAVGSTAASFVCADDGLCLEHRLEVTCVMEAPWSCAVSVTTAMISR